MRRPWSYLAGVVLALALLTSPFSSGAAADGTETLGPPSIPIASGNGMVAGGTGLINGETGTITLDVPLGVSVEQVLLYWEGQAFTEESGFDDDIVVGGQNVEGVLIGGPTRFFSAAWSSTYRADITDLGLVDPGLNTISVSGLDFDRRSNGAGILVITSDGGPDSSLAVRDGNDLAYIGFDFPLDSTVPQTVTFPPAPADRVATIDIFASSVAGDFVGDRPNIILVTVDGVVTQFDNVLNNSDGKEWDTVRLDVTVPAGATTLTLELVSDDPATPNTGANPASLAWNAAAFNIPPAPDPGIAIEKLTNGNDADGANDGDVPEVAPGDPVTWTYLVTNTGDVPFAEADVVVTDDIVGPITTIVDQGDGDGVLAPGETWTYEALAVGGAQDLTDPEPGTVIVDGCNPDDTTVQGDRATYENIGTVSVPGDSDEDPSHYCNPPDPGIDIEKFTKVIPTQLGGDVCETYDKPAQLTMLYTRDGPEATSNSQDSGKVVVTGDPNSASPVYILASKDPQGGGDVYFAGTVNLGEVFVIDSTLAGQDNLASSTHVTIYASQGGAVLQEVEFHTSCSQPLFLGDQFGSIQLVAFADRNGEGETLPPPDGDIGEDADTPTGPEATAGDTIQWTYLVTNPGDLPLTDVIVGDDNGTPADTSDDFAPAPVTEGGVNVGDDNGDGNLDPGEIWVYRATGTAILGQYANISEVRAVPVGGGKRGHRHGPESLLRRLR
jgi:uncharacterized repeat protein (TIGR01451 family)